MTGGYSRLAADEESLAIRLDVLCEAGCKTVFEDTGSGARWGRRGLSLALGRRAPFSVAA